MAEEDGWKRVRDENVTGFECNPEVDVDCAAKQSGSLDRVADVSTVPGMVYGIMAVV